MDILQSVAQTIADTGKRRTLSDLAAPDLPAELRQRLPEAEAHSQRQIAAVVASVQRVSKSVLSRLKAVLLSKRALEHRYDALLEVVDEIADIAASKAACKRGCSHCCHGFVSVPEAEAQLIGKRIRRSPEPAQYEPPRTERAWGGYDRPCPFLDTGGACGIYVHRPFVCRTHFNMDRDDLLCRLRPDTIVPLPGLDVGALKTVAVELFRGSPVRDIRTFFPPADAPSGLRQVIPLRVMRPR